MTWFFNNEGEADGPHDDPAMMVFVSTGRVDSQTLIWHNGQDHWQAAGTLSPYWWQPAVAKPLLKTSGSTTTGPLSAHRTPVPLAPTHEPMKKKAGLLKRIFGRGE